MIKSLRLPVVGGIRHLKQIIASLWFLSKPVIKRYSVNSSIDSMGRLNKHCVFIAEFICLHLIHTEILERHGLSIAGRNRLAVKVTVYITIYRMSDTNL